MSKAQRKIINTELKKLTHLQRLAMTLEAQAECDMEYRRDILSSCTRKQYSMTDRAFTDMLERSQIESLIFGVVMQPLIIHSMYDTSHAQQAEVEAVAIYKAFNQHNLDIYGVNADTMVRAWLEPFIMWLEYLKQLAGCIELDKKLYSHYYKLFTASQDELTEMIEAQ